MEPVFNEVQLCVLDEDFTSQHVLVCTATLSGVENIHVDLIRLRTF